MRQFRFAALLLTLFITSCAAPFNNAQTGPQTATAPTSSSAPVELPHAPEIRFALVGEPTDVNVWAMFDEQGASYANYALRNEYWPRLYTLAPPDLVFTPRAASGEPAPVIQEDDFFTSTVTLRSDLKWTDGSPFTAEDVAFAVNAALQFELGFDWKAHYSPDYLARAEAVDAATVKFYFNQRPNVGIWQYGALQGPILQKAYWEPKVTDSAALLPDDALRASIADASARIAHFQPIVDSLTAEYYSLQSQGKYSRELETDIKRNQGDLDNANNDLAKFLAEYADKVTTAHQSLYALDDQDEPTLGVWMPAGKEGDKWVNEANPDFPFEKPNFDRIAYSVFEDENAAFAAFHNGEADVILSMKGVSNDLVDVKPNPTSSLRFLVFNPAHPELADPALRRAAACMMDQTELTYQFLEQKAAQLWGVVSSDPWQNREAIFGCSGMDRTLRVQNAVENLKQAGYEWEQEPTSTQAGRGLLLPGGVPFPSIALLVPPEDVDPLRASAALYVEAQFQYLGIPITKQTVSTGDIRYAVYSNGDYDMVILGWRLGLYPGYLCEWFGAQGQFDYNESRIRSECEALGVESDLEAARLHVHEIQSILAEDLPFIPLYAGLTYDAYRDVRYPFENVPGGLSGLYGAPSLAIPSQ
ncbi:MAG: ABC transporter substrate-binding protein [Chloroflexi bacterium]|nr:ABC transporter substrate-binding protein [Chloroflexota bacterium]